MYYEITDKGRAILKRKRVSVILSLISMASIFLGSVGIWLWHSYYPSEGRIVDKVSGMSYLTLFLIVFGIFMLTFAYYLDSKNKSKLQFNQSGIT